MKPREESFYTVGMALKACMIIRHIASVIVLPEEAGKEAEKSLVNLRNANDALDGHLCDILGELEDE